MEPTSFSIAQKVAGLTSEQKQEVFGALSAAEQEALRDYWPFWARPQQLPPSGKWSVWLFMAGRGAGKALALDTPIATPSGWTTMGELRVGDEVFDENGSVCRVTFATPVQYDRRCYEVVFDDGCTIVADAEHRWLTWDESARQGQAEQQVRTTERILQSFSDKHSVPVCKPLDLPEIFGDVDAFSYGTSYAGDEPFPAKYLRSSSGQRQKFFDGLVYAHGIGNGPTSGIVVSDNRNVLYAANELALTLGYRVFWDEDSDSVWYTYGESAHRYIVDVRPVPSVPVRCIQVDSPNHLFLAGRTLIPTHNTRSGAEWVKDRCLSLDPPGGPPRGAFIAPTLEDVRLVMVEGESGLLRCLPPSMLVKGSVEESWNRVACELTLANGAKMKGFSSEKAGRLRGPQHHFVWCDEPAEFRDASLGLKEDTTFAMALIGCRLPPDPRVMATGTPKNVRLIHDLLGDPTTVVTRGTTYDNLVNLGDEYRERILTRYEGTRLGRQELMAELLVDAGSVFSRQWFPVVTRPLQGPNVKRIRGWDLAATEPSDGNPDPDWTVGALVAWDGTKMVEGSDVPGVLQIQHVTRWRKGPGATQDGVLRQTQIDALPRVLIEKEGGSAGKSLIAAYSRALSGLCRVEGIAPSGDKQTRAEIWSLLAEQGRVTLLEGDWTKDFLEELEEFPVGAHDDQIDAVSLAAGWLTGKRAARRRRKVQQVRMELPAARVSARPVARLR